jgi:hypothetical protein
LFLLFFGKGDGDRDVDDLKDELKFCFRRFKWDCWLGSIVLKVKSLFFTTTPLSSALFSSSTSACPPKLVIKRTLFGPADDDDSLSLLRLLLRLLVPFRLLPVLAFELELDRLLVEFSEWSRFSFVESFTM